MNDVEREVTEQPPEIDEQTLHVEKVNDEIWIEPIGAQIRL